MQSEGCTGESGHRCDLNKITPLIFEESTPNNSEVDNCSIETPSVEEIEALLAKGETDKEIYAV